LGLTYIGLGSLGIDKALTLLRSLFANVKRAPDQDFIEFAARMAGGVPFYLHVLFRSFLETGDLRTIPESLSEFLVERLSQLPEPARSVYDAIVILGSHSSETRLAQVTELPRYELIGSIRMLDAAGLIHVTSDTIRPSHELFATTAIRQMPVSISRLLHRAAARLLETESPQIEPLELAAHWEACNEQVKVFDTLMRSAADYLRLGRAREAITLLERARKTGGDEASQRQSGVALFLAFCAAGDSSEAIAMAEALRLADGNLGPELQLREIEARGRAGQPVAEFRTLLTGLVFDGNSGDAIRLQAAKLLMMIAEDANDVELARSVLDAVDYTDQESLNKLVVGLIYETVFGDSKVALQIARRLCDTFGRGSNAEAMEVLSNAGFALWRNGECDEGIALYERAYGVARSQRIWSSCLLISASIADMHWIAGRTAKADEWLEIAGRHFDQMDHPDRGFQYLALRVVRLLEHGDVDAADATLAHAERVYPTILRDRYGLERLAYRLRIQLARGGPVDPAQVQELLAGHIARRDKGLQDVVADTVIGSLIHGGRSDEARTVRDDYLKVYRRDGFPPPRALTYLRA
jgi:tetratricopeptide (TPR) repeat protein